MAIASLAARALARAPRSARRVSGGTRCPFAFSPGALQLVQLPEFARAREHAARGELALAAPLISRTLEVCGAMRVPPMELLALEATAHVQGSLGHTRDELRTRERQHELAAGCGAEEAALALHGLALARLRAGDAAGAREAAEERRALGLEGEGAEAARRAFALHGVAAGLLGGSADTPALARALVGGAEGGARPPDGWHAACARLLLAEYEVEVVRWPADALATLAPLCAEPEPGAAPELGEERAWALQLRGRAHLALRASADAERDLGAALSLWRQQCGDGSRPLALCTLDLAALYADRAEPIMAEGLLRSAADSLVAAPCAGTLAGARALHGALRAYAALLDGLETNGRPRSSEAAQLRAQADELAGGFGGVAELAGEPAGAPGVRQPATRALLDWYIGRAECRWWADA